MYGESNYSLPSWYVVHTHPKQEERAENNLRAWDIETFAPRLKERRYNSFTGQPFSAVKPLFSRYIFARFDLDGLFHKVRFTRGVHSLVSFHNTPVPVDDEVISVIRSQMDKDGYVRIGEKLRPGDKVVAKEGPFVGIVGIFEREMKESERVLVLLNTVNYQAHVMFERGVISKCLQSGFGN